MNNCLKSTESPFKILHLCAKFIFNKNIAKVKNDDFGQKNMMKILWTFW
jgi:hypothetical protein